MITCSKTYSDIPFAHRQPNHDGHCAYIHGHNWSVSLTFSATKLDNNGFVVDFGKTKYIKKWIEENLDHCCLLNLTDPCILDFQNSKYFKLFLISDCSCEGLAVYLFKTFNALVSEEEKGRVKITEVTVTEDSKNSATYSE
jgi:6-pyruvoyltetrahydropterin/6-carboxytetrahydropterin synthase